MNSIKRYVTPEQSLYFSFSLFILVQYVVSAAAVTTISFYLLVTPALLWLLYEQPRTRQSMLKSRLLKAFLGLFVFIILHALFLTNGMEGASKTIRNTLATTIFLLSSTAFFCLIDGERLKRFYNALVIAACLCSLYSLYRYFFNGYMGDNHRLIPYGRAAHEILGAHVIGIAGLVALYLSAQTKNLKERGLYLLACMLIGYLILLTGSRTPIVAYCLSLLLGILAFYPLRMQTYVKLAIAMLIVAVAVFYFTDFAHVLQRFKTDMIKRGDNSRFELWGKALARIQQHPFFGNGMRARLIPPASAPEVYSPHNLYLGTAFYIGIPAALFFCACVSYVGLLSARWLWHRHAAGSLAAIILIQGLISGLSDHGQLVKAPAPLWLIFWLPIAMVIALHTGTSQASTPPEASNAGPA